MAYLSKDALHRMEFAHLGRNVRISTRAALYDTARMHLGDNSRIDDFCVVSGRVETGRNVHFAPFCLVAGGRPGVFIQDFAGLAYRVSVFAQSDDYSGATMTNPTVPPLYKTETLAPVHIGRHVIIGASAIVVPGVDLAEGTAVGAGSLVLKSTEAWSVVVGTPARRLRARSRTLLEQEAAYLHAERAAAERG